MSWASRHNKGSGAWCPENDGAYQAEQAAIHGEKRLMAQNMSTVVIVGDHDAFSENLNDMLRAYGCDKVVVGPTGTTPINRNELIITFRDGWYNWAKKQSYPFSVRFVTFKVAMEMVAVNKEEGFS